MRKRPLPRALLIQRDSESSDDVRVSCCCGWEDKAYRRAAKSVASYHNMSAHGGSYAIHYA